MKRSRIQRRAPIRRGKRINPVGPKGRAWRDVRNGLKTEFEFTYGITTCELRYEGCWNDDALGFAHAAKRRKLIREDLKHVILACNPCHDLLEVKPPEEMKRIVDQICQQRESMLISRQLSAL